MARLRYNGLSTTLGGSGLTNSATSVTFAAALTHSGGTNVPTITGTDYIPLSILDSTGKLSEVVYLTAYTAAATTGTIVRGMEGTTGVSHSLGDKVICGPTVIDVRDSADVPPASPNAKDDEFDGSSSVTWTASPTAPTTFDRNSTIPGQAYLRSNGLGLTWTGEYQAIPASYPFTITAKGYSTRRGNNHIGSAIYLAPASPTGTSAFLMLGGVFTAGAFTNQRISYSSHNITSSFVSSATAAGLAGWSGPLYLRIVAASATSIKTQMSHDGRLWHTLDSAFNPGFTPGVMGIGHSENGTADLESTFEYFRVS